MEQNFAQLITDSPISANWIIAGVLMVAIYFQKRANDKADAREKKIDEILESQSKQLSLHEAKLMVHEEKLGNSNEMIENVQAELRAKLIFLKS